MLLRSSSTPVLGSLVSSCSESSNNSHNHHHYQPELTLTPNRHPPLPPTHHKITFHHSPVSQNPFSCNSSPISPSVHNNGFFRAQSEGNLESLVRTATSNDDDFSFATPSKKFSSRHNSSLLETIPSFSFHKSTGRFEDDDFSDEDEEDEEFNEYDHHADNPIKGEGRLQNSNLDMEKKIIALNEQMRHATDYGNVVLKDKIEDPASQMYLAKGLGVEIGFGSGGGGGGSGGNYTPIGFGKSGGGDSNGGSHDIEEHYKKMVNDNPGNPLFSRNYAQYLYQSKQDLNGAEEYYSRAILADPNDGEILSQYANILWELHQDKDRATSYYERAVQAAFEDSHVHAAYASFLWEAEDEEEDDAQSDSYAISTVFHKGAMTPATA